MKTLLTTSFTVLIFQVREIPFSMKVQVLQYHLLTKTKKIIQTFLYGNPTYSFNNSELIHDASISWKPKDLTG